MSKVDAQRAMREAKYAERNSGQPAARPAARPAAEPRKAPAPVEADAAGDELCGHRSMNGRTCTRERGHDAKSHRYS